MSRPAAKVVPIAQARHPRPKRRWRVRPGRWLTFLIFAYILFLFGRQEYTLYKMRSEANGIRSSIQAMQSENDQLRAQIEQMNQDGYVERIAREQLGLVKANETSYVPAEVRDLP